MNDISDGTPESAEPEPVAVATLESAPPPPPRSEPRQPSILDLLVNPRAFFEALEARPVSLRVPALIVLLVGVAGAITAYQVSSVLMEAIAIQGVQGLGGVLGVIGAISALIFTMLFWVIYTAIFFIISMAFNGRGDFNRLLEYVGYGHLPQVIGGVISLVLSWSYLSTLRIPPLTTPQAIQEWTSTLTKDPTMKLSIVVGLIFLLWSANIWIFGVRSGRKLSTRDAAITVGVPVLLYLLYSIYTLVV